MTRHGATQQQPDCPASHNPCSHQCWLRPRCETEPERIMRFVQRLDEQITAALSQIARNQ